MFIRHYYVIQDKISFAWSTKSDLQQGKLNVKATDWNKLTQNINNIRASIGLSSLTFTTVNAGDYIYYNYFNQVVSALENLKARGTLHYTFTLIEVSRDNYILINTHILNLETAVNST
jgi:hypothetical protein